MTLSILILCASVLLAGAQATRPLQKNRLSLATDSELVSNLVAIGVSFGGSNTNGGNTTNYVYNVTTNYTLITATNVISGIYYQGTNGGYTLLTVSNGYVYLPLAYNSITPNISIAGTTVMEPASGTTNAAFVVSLSSAPNVPVTFRYATYDGSAVSNADYVATNGTITIAPGNTNATIYVGINSDGIVETTEAFTVGLSNITNAFASIVSATGFILDYQSATNYDVLALSAAEVDVSNAVQQAGLNSGKRVRIPPGTVVWTNQFNFAGVKLSGSGTNATIITSGVIRNYDYTTLFSISGATTNTALTDLKVVGGNSATPGYGGEIIVNTTNQVELARLMFDTPEAKTIQLAAAYKTLVHYCFFSNFNSCVYVTDGGANTCGDEAFARPLPLGQTNLPVIEDCYFTNTIGVNSSVMDSESGGAFVFRRNTTINSKLDNHGTETGQRHRGARGFEIYNNTFTDQSGNLRGMQIRSGTGVVFSNTFTGYSSFATMDVYRATKVFTPWDASDGFHHMDGVVGTNYFAGLASVSTNYLQIATNAWAVNQWVGYTVVNTDLKGPYISIVCDNSGCYTNSPGDYTNANFAVISSNSANQIFYLPPERDYPPVWFTNGNHYVINQVYPLTDMPGRGQGDLLAFADNTVGYPSNTVTHLVQDWPRQTNEMIYWWSNTINGSPAVPTSGFVVIKAGRDYTNNFAKPGYTPLVYPYPLVP